MSGLASAQESLISKPTITLALSLLRRLNLHIGIREYWGIENRLHWVKDVIFGEDAAPFRDYNAATNWSLIRTLVINIARTCGYDSLTKAERFLAHDIDKLIRLLE
ncbi:transposase [Chroococcidiopsis sp. CCMEE 29]|uniref:transposase n=1 Tax=Chroococcidiopsis sp. CCMEE 29 TaxID=155894 RepID=UPI002020F137|nr:transposase [Chroococcidiopsis sp. CCMEE 29]